MKTLIMIFFYVFMLVGGVSIFIGLDLKKWYSWLIAACGFVIGFLMGLVWVDFNTAVTAGVLFAFLTLASGASVHWNRQRWQSSLENIDSKKYPLLTKWTNILKKLFRI